jgi:hypothetical protein
MEAQGVKTYADSDKLADIIGFLNGVLARVLE